MKTKKTMWGSRAGMAALLVFLGCSNNSPNGCSNGEGSPVDLSGFVGDSSPTTPTLLPIPYDWHAMKGDKNVWKGTNVQLMFADALVGCSTRIQTDGSGSATYYQTAFLADVYREHVQALMDASHCTLNAADVADGGVPESGKDVLAAWAIRRARPSCNRDPVSLQQSPAPITANSSFPDVAPVKCSPTTGCAPAFVDYPDYAMGTATGGLNVAGAVMAELLAPEVNLCIAMRLRAFAPGASGAEAVLLNEVEQREIQTTALERAQRAVLGFANLGLLFTADPGPAPPVSVASRGYYLSRWGQDPANADKLKTYGVDFAAAVQLHAVLAEETAAFFARTASAVRPRGGRAATRMDEIWGSGSWRQRTMALLYGGRPLAVTHDSGAPWSAPWKAAETPFVGADDDGFSTGLLDWPGADRLPYPRYDVPDAETQLFAKMAAALPKTALFFLDAGAACKHIDVEATGLELYRNVECTILGECKTPVSEKNLPALELWKRYRLRPGHAVAYARILADRMEPICAGSVVGWNAPGASIDASVENGFVSSVVLKGRVTEAARPIAMTAPLFARGMPWAVPVQVAPAGCLAPQGFAEPKATQLPSGVGVVPAPTETPADWVAWMGAAAALSATRDALATMSQKNPGVLATFLPDDVRASLQELVNAQVGTESFALRRMKAAALTASGSGVGTSGCVPLADAGWAVDIVGPASDPWFSSPLSVAAIGAVPWAASLAMHPSRTAFSSTSNAIIDATSAKAPLAVITTPADQLAGLVRLRATLPLASPQGGVPFTASPMTLVTYRGAGGTRQVRHVGSMVGVGSLEQNASIGVHVATGGKLGRIAQELTAFGEANPAQPQFDGFGLETTWVPPADSALFGGKPGEDAVSFYLASAKTAAQEATAAVNTALDGLSRQKTDQVAARSAAQKADELNKLEVASLCGDKNTDCSGGTTTVQAPLLRWKAEWLARKPRVCLGALPDYQIPGGQSLDSPGGSISMFTAVATGGTTGFSLKLIDDATKLLSTVTPTATDLGNADLSPKLTPEDRAGAAVLLCAAFKNLGVLAGDPEHPETAPMIAIARAVNDQRDAPVQPAFAELSGGALQRTMITQWAALHELTDLGDEYIKASQAAVQAVLQSRAAASGAVKNYHDSCNPAEAGVAAASCWETTVGFPSIITVRYNPAPMLAYKQKCRDLAAAAGPLIQEVERRQAEALASLSVYGTRFSEGVKNAYLASAEASAATQAARTAQAKNNLEASLAHTAQTTSYNLYRRYHAYDLWRAKALLDGARRHAAVARHAIEARYAVNLSDLTADEPFVAAPVSWADEVYASDLSLPAAVGLAKVPQGQPTGAGIYPNKVLDYVANLEGFVQGYTLRRAIATVKDDVDIVTLAGPYARHKNDKGVIVPVDEALRWQVYCPNVQEWRSLVKAKPPASPLPPTGPYELGYEPIHAPCAEVPVKKPANQGQVIKLPNPHEKPPLPSIARVTFTLDPWGRAEGSVASPPYEARYNARWTRFAVNLAGTGVLDCTKADDAAACFGQAFVRFNLEHVGPGWVADIQGQYRAIDALGAFVEGGKALASEKYWDPIATLWSAPGVAPIVREELVGRPLGGSYQLDLMLGPELDLERLDRVQILVGSSYWVKQ